MDSQCALLLANQSGDLVCAAIAGPYTEGIVGYAVKGERVCWAKPRLSSSRFW